MLFLNDKISIRQLQVLLILDIFGTGVIILPRRVAEFGAQDGWIVVIIATLIAVIYAYLISTIGGMFHKESFVSYTQKILGKPIAFFIALGLIAKIIISIAMELRFFGEIVKQTMLYNTPFWVVCLTMLLVGGYAAAKGYEARGRIAEILIFVIFIPLIIVFILAAFNVQLSNILPVFTAKPENLIKGGFSCSIAFTGLEFILLVHPYMQNPKKVRKATIISVLSIGLLMIFITIITIGKFGPYDVARQMWPVLEIMDTIDLPGSFIERQEGFIMSFWIISVFAIVNAGLFFSSVISKDLIKKGQHSTYIIISLIVVFIISFIPKDIPQVSLILDYCFMTFGLAYFIVIPLLLIAVAKIRRLGEKNEKS